LNIVNILFYYQRKPNAQTSRKPFAWHQPQVGPLPLSLTTTHQVGAATPSIYELHHEHMSYSSNMPPIKRKVNVAPRPVPVKKPRLSVLKPASSSTPVYATANRNYDLGKYPWDDSQDVVVSSVETNEPQILAGVEHYLHLTDQIEYEHVCVHFDEYRTIEQQTEDTPDSDSEAEEEDGGARDPNIDYTCPAKPPATQSDYHQPIYVAKTFVPAAFLAIVRIAQKNMPFLDLRSAIIHLPNLTPTAAMPKLSRDVFTGDIPSPKRPNHTEMTVALLPDFYTDGRHCVGYYCVKLDAEKVWTQTCLFTPCTSADLRRYGLIEHLPEPDSTITSVKHVGSRNGDWMHDDVVEDYAKWAQGWKVASHVWEKRMCVFRGAGENGARE
jgi:hypothetical protein